MDEKPLATIAVMSYNQLEYIKLAVDGAMKQTYRPLEILVSDDGSTDGSWEYICQLKESEERKCVPGVSWVVNRNEKNLKIVANWQKMVELSHGEIIVKADGDDVSLPNRVGRIVEAWLKGNRTATVFHSGCNEVDGKGRMLRYVGPRNAEWALGGATAYAKWIYEKFPPASQDLKVEDQVWAKRAWMLGEAVQIDEPLVDYRVGGGISTGFKSIRECWRKNGENMLKSLEILDRDVEVMKDSVPSENLARVKAAMDRNRRWATLTYDAVMAKSFKRRVHCLVALMGWSRFLMKGWLYLLPYFPRIKC